MKILVEVCDEYEPAKELVVIGLDTPFGPTFSLTLRDYFGKVNVCLSAAATEEVLTPVFIARVRKEVRRIEFILADIPVRIVRQSGEVNLAQVIQND